MNVALDHKLDMWSQHDGSTNSANSH